MAIHTISFKCADINEILAKMNPGDSIHVFLIPAGATLLDCDDTGALTTKEYFSLTHDDNKGPDSKLAWNIGGSNAPRNIDNASL